MTGGNKKILDSGVNPPYNIAKLNGFSPLTAPRLTWATCNRSRGPGSDYFGGYG